MCLQRAEFVTPKTRDVYCRLAADGVSVHVLGVGVGRLDWPTGVHPHDLAESDPLTRQWVVAFVAPKEGAALSCAEMDRSGVVPDMKRRFHWAITNAGTRRCGSSPTCPDPPLRPCLLPRPASGVRQ